MKEDNKLLKNNKLLLGVALGLVAVMLLLAWVSLDSVNITGDAPEITPRPEEEVKKELDAYYNQPEESDTQYPLGGEVSLLHDSMPYKGEHFSMVYSDEDYYFYYYIDPKNPEAGNTELDEFLERHGISDRSFVKGMFESKTPLPINTAPTPAP